MVYKTPVVSKIPDFSILVKQMDRGDKRKRPTSPIRDKQARTKARQQRNDEEIARKLNEERNEKNSDLVLKVPENDGFVEVYMHRVFADKFFTQQTCEQINETHTRRARFTMTDQFKPSVIQALVDWNYESELPVNLTCETAVVLLRAANFFHRFPDLTEALCEWLLENMQKSDAVAVFDTAGALCKLGADECLKQLSDKAMRVIASNVLSLLESGSLDQLPTIVEDMRFIASEHLALDVAKRFASNGNHEQLLKVNYGQLSKPTLAREVKWLTNAGLMSPELTQHVLRSSLKPTNMTRKYGLEGAIVCVAVDGETHALVRGPTDEYEKYEYEAYELPPIFQPTEVIGANLPFDHSICVVVDGGKLVVIMAYGERRHVYSYDPETAMWWYKGLTSESGVSESAVAVTSEGIALLGGSIDPDGETPVGWCEIQTKSAEGVFWGKMPPLPVPLAGGCALAVDDRVFFVGGQNDSGPSSAVFVHRFGGKGFTHIGNLGDARWDFAAVLVDKASGPEIYCFGGAGLLSVESRSSCEVFDVNKKKSTPLTRAPIGDEKIHSAWHRGGDLIEVVAGNLLLEYSIAFDSWKIVSHGIPSCAKAVRFPLA